MFPPPKAGETLKNPFKAFYNMVSDYDITKRACLNHLIFAVKSAIITPCRGDCVENGKNSARRRFKRCL